MADGSCWETFSSPTQAAAQRLVQLAKGASYYIFRCRDCVGDELEMVKIQRKYQINDLLYA